MKLRPLLDALDEAGELHRIKRRVDPHLEIAGVVHALDERPVLFEDVAGSDLPVVAGLCGHRDVVARSFGVEPDGILDALRDALGDPHPPETTDDAPCREVVTDDVDLERLPILKHFPDDAGPYATAAICIVDDPDLGPNASFHRLLRIGPDRFTGRFVELRGTDTAWRKADEPIPVAVCLGSSVHVSFAAAISPDEGTDELAIANALEETPVVETENGLHVPADTEIVLEGHLLQDQAPEGPFIDLTETLDVVRDQAVLQVDRVTRREDAIYQALLSGGREHKLLMGLPREVTIHDEVARVADVREVALTRGGGSWLHAVVQIQKTSDEEAREAIDAAFRGHSSLKHVVVVDDDVDVHDPVEVEWAMATRFQADRDLHVFEDRPSSSLDPSAQHRPGEKTLTTKTGFDCTIPEDRDPSDFEKLEYEDVDADAYLG